MEPNQSSRHIVHTASGRAYHLPIDRDRFRSLLRYVDEMCALQGCDNTLQHANTWARANGVPWAGLAKSLRGLGGFCDCEIGMNVAEGEPDEYT
jgi:Protein of unknown function (DUF2695)